MFVSIADLLVSSDDKRCQICRVRNIRFVVKSRRPVRVFHLFDQFAVGNHRFARIGGNYLFARRFIVGKIIRRKPEMRFFGFALRPNLRVKFYLVIFGNFLDKINSFVRFCSVFEIDGNRVFPIVRFIEIDNNFFVF